MDQMVRTYTCKRRTRRWPMVLWHNVLDVATLNAFTSYTAQHPGYMGGWRKRKQVKRKRCKICPTAKDRKASSWCSKCTSPVCKEHKHVVVICEACMH
ncbi:hypothetical protein KUCAC02_012620 [Chaenocephalus aceratus]|uniref:Uncharacterized protein n=2 Tax=Chaenocephalus aceratus TaxID=36190 RepID=A0ACB9XCU6_CHAAC|nr:hypothetical protein KUCAC02_012141 [Chaenocephalus aceratus]KAI4824077.1 hypothetical protein KUCAC02_012620 [Chaenocephalus aceratus]